MLLHSQDKTKTQFRERVVEQSLLFLRAIARVFSCSIASKSTLCARFESRAPAGPFLSPKLQQPEMVLGLGLQRNDKELKSGGRKGIC